MLDILLQFPGLDINKPDNDGNTPLHFAAEWGMFSPIFRHYIDIFYLN